MKEEQKIKIAQWLLNPDQENYEAPANLAVLERALKKFGVWKVYEEIELPLIPILEEMHGVGIKADREWLLRESKNSAKELAALEKDIYRKIGKRFNLNSPQQLGEILFGAPPEGLGIAAGKRARTKTGGYATDAAALETIRGAHPAVPRILRYRKIFKLRSTYLEPLHALTGKDGRVHTTYLQTVTGTGRLSSENPNLQNVPPEIKPAFVAEKGFLLAAFDYSQIELRVLASVSGDESMLAAFHKGEDIHALTAAQIYGVSRERVTQEMRQVAKTLNFGIIYGMGSAAFAAVAGITREEAQNFIDEYFVRFSGVRRWQEKVLREARATGMVTNQNNRRRLVPAIVSPNRRFAAEAERKAFNFPIQSVAADIIKLAMIRVRELVRRKKWDARCRMLLTIHDELLFEAENGMIREAREEIVGAMEAAYPLKVPLVVNASSGARWSELK